MRHRGSAGVTPKGYDHRKVRYGVSTRENQESIEKDNLQYPANYTGLTIPFQFGLTGPGLESSGKIARHPKVCNYWRTTHL